MKHHRTRLLLLTLVVAGGLFIAFKNGNDTPAWVTDVVTHGTVSTLVSVSGTMDATHSAALSFPTTGILESIAVAEGDIVAAGTPLATLAHDGLKADYEDARASLLIAQADRTATLNGITGEARDVLASKVAIAEEEVVRITKEFTERETNAYRTLLSADLAARPQNKNNEDTPPLISGTYTCGEGTYTLTLFKSSARSGYSYSLSGLETGVYQAYVSSPGPLGTCGLTAQFADEEYVPAKWDVRIPNTDSASYLTNLNAYNLAITQRAGAVAAAEQNLELAKRNATLDTAQPRSESRIREDARVLQAQARLDSVNAQIQNHVLTAPFDGIVTKIYPTVGETVGAEPVLAMISEDAYTLTALIPEIDITRIVAGQHADIRFDARADETLSGFVLFVSPLARKIEGVSYFEATFALETNVDWLRSGLNADVDIVVERRDDVLRIPSRFLTEVQGVPSVYIPLGTTKHAVPVTMHFRGNDGFAHIEGLAEGQIIIAP